MGLPSLEAANALVDWFACSHLDGNRAVPQLIWIRDTKMPFGIWHLVGSNEEAASRRRAEKQSGADAVARRALHESCALRVEDRIQ